MTTVDTEPSLATLSGLITDDVGDALQVLAGLVPQGQCVVEIGSYRGQSTAYLASGVKRGVKVFAVDAWDLPGNVFGKHGFSAPIVREQFEQQLKALRLWSKVTPKQGFSTIVASEWDGPPVGLLFLDGDHSERSVRDDATAWHRHLADGHVIALDDLDTPRNPGVRVVVNELVAAGYSLDVQAERLAVMRVAG